MNALGYTLLGLLGREPLTGYELTRRLKERVGNFWSTSHSQVYPELARLEAEELVTHQVVEQRERPDKKVYAITDQGMEALKEWVTTPVGPRTTRDELVLRAYCVWVADSLAAAALFREHERRHAVRLADYEGKAAWMEQEWGEDRHRPSSPHFASYAAIRRGIGHEREYAAWCRWVAECLEAGDAGATIAEAGSPRSGHI
ncbi:MAG: PadR family transcriptional regulator [Chloroflexota bacterium]|nr:PadR family transcriptional regulator [Chloroflexota bacterium]